jgi:LacI family transcriptional regulator
VRMLGCDGLVLSPVGASDQSRYRELDGIPMVLLGGPIESDAVDTVTIDNRSAGRLATDYLLDLQHTRIGSITGPLQLSTGRGRNQGFLEAMSKRGLSPQSGHVRTGEFREDAAYSIARDLLQQSDRPSALYVANGVMALGVMRAIVDLGLDCPGDISIVSTDTIAGVAGLRPRLTRTEHPVAEMTNEAVRMLVDRIDDKVTLPARNIVFQPTLVIGDSCAPLRT